MTQEIVLCEDLHPLGCARRQHPAPLHVRGREVRTLEPSHTSPPVGVRTGPLVPDQFELQPLDRGATADEVPGQRIRCLAGFTEKGLRQASAGGGRDSESV